MAAAKRRTRTDREEATRNSACALDLDAYIPAHLTFLANKISSSAATLYRTRFGVGIVDWRIMALLACEAWIASARICEATGLDKAAVSRSLAVLQKKGLVETKFQGENRRRRFLALTPEGIELHDRIVVIARRREDNLLRDFSTSERNLALDLLLRLRARASEPGGVDP